MPDKKPTDNLANNSPILANELSDDEIVKALECCSTASCISNKCHYEKLHDIPTCTTKLTKDALDLINRQKAEIERLTAERDAMHQDVIAAEEYDWQCKTAKVEAIKEFAERVEPLKKFRSCMGNSVYELSVTMREIDDILKEMVGDNNAE